MQISLNKNPNLISFDLSFLSRSFTHQSIGEVAPMLIFAKKYSNKFNSSQSGVTLRVGSLNFSNFFNLKPFNRFNLTDLKSNLAIQPFRMARRLEQDIALGSSRNSTLFWSNPLSFLLRFLLLFIFSFSMVQAGTVTLTWGASSGPVAGYRVYYGTQSKAYTSNTPAAPSLLSTTSYKTPDLPAGTYYFAVKAFDSAGNSSDYSNEVANTITGTATAPKANFSSNKTTGSAPLAVAFTDSSTGTISNRSWNFGDGTTSTAQNPSKTYNKTGSYTVTLTVNGSAGSNTMTKTNYISVAALTSTAPVASFSASPTSGTTSTTFNFANTSTGNATSWAWNFGDGTTSSAKTAIKTYSKPGTYTVTLKATGPGGSNTATKTSYITVSAAAPIASFSATPTSGAAPLTTVFKNTSTGTITSYSWNFGDGGTSSESAPAHTYAKTGSYTVQLTAKGPAGANSKTQTSYITVTSTGANSGGLVAAYNFEEASGATIVDLSGRGNAGAIAGAARTTSGKYGRALAFDGVDDLVTVADSATLDLTTGMTLEAWVYPTVNTGWRTVILKESAPSYYLYSNTTFANAPAMGTKVGDYPLLYGNGSLATNSWSHLATTYDGVNQRLYVNGSLVAQRSIKGGIETSSKPLRIGGNSAWGEYFKGSIDDIRIYNRALSISEIQTDMNTPVK
ncbi:MAG TPA: PKD domain-containing protein [Candidatus Competibacter sp.]|nr:PKD domain-containing protein [Candidatus Competibacter sp.]